MDTATRRQFLEALQKAQRVYRMVLEEDADLIEYAKSEVASACRHFTGSHAEYVLLSKDSDAVVELKDALTLDEAIAFVFFDMNKVIYHSIVKKCEHVAKCDAGIEKVKQESRMEKHKSDELIGNFDGVKQEILSEFTFNFLKLFYDTKNTIIDDMKGSSKVGMLDIYETFIRPKDAIQWAKTNGYVVAQALETWLEQQAAPSPSRAENHSPGGFLMRSRTPPKRRKRKTRPKKGQAFFVRVAHRSNEVFSLCRGPSP